MYRWEAYVDTNSVGKLRSGYIFIYFGCAISSWVHRQHFPQRTAHNILPPFAFPLYIRCSIRMYWLKRALKWDSVRYSALYVINVSIVTIMAYTERERANTIAVSEDFPNVIQSRRKQCVCVRAKHIAHPSKNISHSFIRYESNVLCRISNFYTILPSSGT